jgi:ABC-type glutathione transport system ATPase component
MGFLTGLFWLFATIAAALAAGWLFRAAAIAASPQGLAREFRTMPLTASFGLLMILIYILVAIFAPALAPFSETEIVGREYIRLAAAPRQRPEGVTPMTGTNKEVLLTMKGLRIEGRADEEWLEIVKGVDLTLHKGEVLGLIGESGAGKSTIGLAAMGFARDGCRISGGRDPVRRDRPARRLRGGPPRLRGKRIAYVAQSAAASFNPAHKLIDQYSEAPVQHHVMGKSEAETDAVDLYRRMQLPNPDEIGFRYPHQVSGGQLQRAMTAMAMACRPDLIIFDEPTTALDVTTQIEVLAAIRDIVEQFDTAAIYITHDLAVVAQMADKIKVLLKGEEVEEADTRTMLDAPRRTTPSPSGPCAALPGPNSRPLRRA